MLRNPAGERNVAPILDVLRKYIDGSQSGRKLLEISSGTGYHMPHIARAFPKLSLQPSEFETGMFASIREYSRGCASILPPIFIDISQSVDDWSATSDGQRLSACTGQFDYVLNVNMIHITPFRCAEMLFRNASRLLKGDGLLFTYGPYRLDGVLAPDSNVRFDESLRSRDPSWGIRDVRDLEAVATQVAIVLEKIHDMPANNKLLVWRKK